MILDNLETTQTIINGKRYDFDRYNFFLRTPFSLKEISITINFINNTISGELLGTENVVKMFEEDIVPYIEKIKLDKILVRDTDFALFKYTQ